MYRGCVYMGLHTNFKTEMIMWRDSFSDWKNNVLGFFLVKHTHIHTYIYISVLTHLKLVGRLANCLAIPCGREKHQLLDTSSPNLSFSIYIYIYMCGLVFRVPTPPNGMGPQVASPALLFASYWQHFWGPASYLLGFCSDSDYQPPIY